MSEPEDKQLHDALERAWRWMQGVDLEKEPQRYVDEYNEDAELIQAVLNNWRDNILR